MGKKKKIAVFIICFLVICSVTAGISLYVINLPAQPVFEKKDNYMLSNPNADNTTKDVYNYICQCFGTYMLSAQQESTWMSSPEYEMEYIEKSTGKLPAIRGLDYMNNDYDGVNRRAIEWWNRGGLVTICWHTGLKSSGYEEAKADEPDFDRLFTEGTEEYNTLMETWDIAATHLQELQEAGVTVLWRPFHEFDGQWFWWGKGGAENFKKLWRMMYEKFTYEYGLNNLIWVLGYSHETKSGWYVGNEYCDIIGADIYDDSVNFYNWKSLTKIGAVDKPYAFHECGKVPEVSEFVDRECLWVWFMPWHTEWITGNDPEELSEIYNSSEVITLDELPDFRK